jgi:hypothetical protein
MPETVTVHVYEGARTANYDDLFGSGPDVYELPVADPDYGFTDALTDDERVILADDIENHRKYGLVIPDPPRTVTLNVHTNDSYHAPTDWGTPIERGLPFPPEHDYEPFWTERWGRVMMWVAGGSR